jgi:3-oxoacyl-[acyl-carrier-protein] synthase III
VAFIESVGLLLPAPRPASPEEVAAAPEWRAVCELPHSSPAEMAIQVGRAALAAAGSASSDIGWVIHCGLSYQGSPGWPVHHHIQDGIVGRHGTAFELRQYCTGALTSWVIADLMTASSGCAAICTGADNWSWCDRFANPRSIGCEPFSDAAHAVVISPRGGFAQILGMGTASCPDQSGPLRTREAYWEHASMDDLRATYSRVIRSRTSDVNRDSLQMMVSAVTTALTVAQVSPERVTHYIPHSSASGEPYRSLAKFVGLPWEESLHQNNLDHGFLGVSNEPAGLIQLAESGELDEDSIVLLLGAEYALGATAVLLRIIRPPAVFVDGVVRTAA